jgi:ribosomal protein L11 methyltransferase
VHAVPADAAVIRFDAGTAFGTGDHPTTRLCAIRMMDFLATHPAPTVSMTDAGCGSGHPRAFRPPGSAAAAWAGFDRDPESVRVSIANRVDNGLADEAAVFHHAGLEEGFKLTGRADVVLANIISDVLCHLRR